MTLAKRVLPTISLPQLVWLLGLSLFISVTLGALFVATLDVWHGPPWRTLGLLHGLVGLLGLACFKELRPKILPIPRHWTYVFAICVLFGSLGLCFLSSWQGQSLNAVSRHLAYAISSITWIPIAEEIVYRGIVGGFLRTQGGPIWGAYFASGIFSLAHVEPTWQRIAAGQLGFALGPFLLGLCCEYILLKSKSLWPCIALHAACNSTAILFTLFGSQWLETFNILYN